MKIFVINLPSSVARKEAIREAFRNLEVDLEFFEAVDGRKGLPSDLESLPDDKHRIYFRSRPLSPGEKGCYASHYKLWQKCVELNEPILILENDCFPTKANAIKKNIFFIMLRFSFYKYIIIYISIVELTYVVTSSLTTIIG